MANDRKNTAGLMKRRAIIAAAVVVMAALGTWGIGSGFVHEGLASLKLIPTPETYTELYFNNTTTLPAASTGLPMSFSFSIHNVTGQDRKYPYDVILVEPTGAEEAITSGDAATTSGQTHVVPVRVTLPRGLVNCQIVVELPAQSQSIDFWIGKTQ